MRFSAIAASVLALVTMTASAAEPAAADMSAMTLESRQVAQDLLKKLGGTLQAEMKANGAEAGIKVCRDVASSMALQASLDKGWKVARVGTRTRNNLVGTPDAWEQAVLDSFQKRMAAGEKIETLEQMQIVEEPSGRSFRYMKAIGTQPQCLACHGPQDQIAPGVKAALGQAYPHDQATGYTVGQLRGAVTIKRPL